MTANVNSIVHIGKSLNTTFKFLLLGLLYLGILHFLDLFNIIATVEIASMVYKGERKTFTDMFKKLIKETRFKGPLITSIQVLLLDSLILIGLVSFGPYIYITMSYFFMVVFSIVFIALFTKYLEWSSVWNLGIVISILEEKQYGDVALVISSSLSRESRIVGLVVVLLFSAWRVVLRLWCFYVGWNIGTSRVAITTVEVGFVTMANVLKWVIFVVYFYDCKKQRSEKAMEDGRTEEQLLEKHHVCQEIN